MEIESFTFQKIKLEMILKYFVLLLLSNIIFCHSYPLFGENRYLRTVPIRRSAYYSTPITHRHNEFQLADYDEGYLFPPPEDYEYSIYDKYQLSPYYGYNSNRNYFYEKTGRRGLDGFEYYEDQNPLEDYQSPKIHPNTPSPYSRGQELWYEDSLPKYDKNNEANAAFLQNLIISQMYHDANNQYPYSYDSPEDYDDQHWSYGVPTTEVEDKEKVRQYFKNKEDEEVKELEMLSRKKDKSKKLKEKDITKKQKIKKPTKSKSKMTEDEYFDMQKQIIVKNRKNNFVPIAEGFRINKKQLYDTADLRNDLWEYYRSSLNNYPETATSSIKKLNINNIRPLKSFSISETDPESATITSTVSPKHSPSVGQKEVVLPRFSNSVRKPFNEISSRSLHQPTVYDTIKKLLDMEKDASLNTGSQVQKRFILSEDQLESELNGLKKTSN